jgi:hypothetical protein
MVVEPDADDFGRFDGSKQGYIIEFIRVTTALPRAPWGSREPGDAVIFEYAVG